MPAHDRHEKNAAIPCQVMRFICNKLHLKCISKQQGESLLSAEIEESLASPLWCSLFAIIIPIVENSSTVACVSNGSTATNGDKKLKKIQITRKTVGSPLIGRNSIKRTMAELVGLQLFGQWWRSIWEGPTLVSHIIHIKVDVFLALGLSGPLSVLR